MDSNKCKKYNIVIALIAKVYNAKITVLLGTV